jgi:hypothetical protein
MSSKNRTIAVQLAIVCLLAGALSQRANGQSLYAITNHTSSIITAYDVNGTTIDYQTDIAVDRGSGAVGLALDPESEILFVTYEASNLIEMVNAKTMIYEQNGLIPRKPRIYTAFSEFSSKNQNPNQHLPLQRRHIYGSAVEGCPADFHDLPSRMRPNAVFVRIYLVCPLFR